MSKFTAMSAGEFLKVGADREKRSVNFVNKILKGDTFVLMNEKHILLKNDPTTIEVFQMSVATKNTKNLQTMTFMGTDRKPYKIKEFAKVPEFGGRGKGSGTTKEEHALTDIREQIERTLFNEGVSAIPIRIGNRTALVTGARTTPGSPKSDFEFVDPDDKTAFWISHKAGKVAKDFQQYGGLIELDPSGSKYPEVKAFIAEIHKRVPTGALGPAETYFRSIKDTKIANLSLFGKNYQSGPANGIHNIDVLMQGDLKLVKNGRIYTITCHHSTLRGTIPMDTYHPCLFVRVDNSRTQYGVRNARFMIASRGLCLYKKSIEI